MFNSYFRQTLEQSWPSLPLYLDIRSNWAADQKDFRHCLRQFMQDKIRRLKWAPNDCREFLLPGNLGGACRGFFSISHCPIAGGFALLESANSNGYLGLDLEQVGRVSTEVAARVSSPQELGSCPDLTSLWVAKESLYKSLPPSLQPKTLANIKISSWKISPSGHVVQFRGGNGDLQHFHNSKGLIMKINDLKMGICFSEA